jgi:hypothetical protein
MKCETMPVDHCNIIIWSRPQQGSRLWLHGLAVEVDHMQLANQPWLHST